MAQPSRMVIEEVTDPEEIARFRAGWEAQARNEGVFRVHMHDLYRNHRGKVVIVAGQELHVAETPAEAWAWARANHPEDEAVLVRTIPKETGWRVYRNAALR